MARYAAGTEVSSDRSRTEIERTLRRYGATQFLYGWSGRRATVGFTAHGRSIRFELPMPDANDREFTRTDTGRTRSETTSPRRTSPAACPRCCRTTGSPSNQEDTDMPTYKFERVTRYVTKYVKCRGCSARLKRSATLGQTINPFNKGANGVPKTRLQIVLELEDEAGTWYPANDICRKCDNLAHARHLLEEC